MKPILVDLFCKAGGATKGYQRAGFFVIGVDIEPQKRYVGDAFVQMDALEALRVLLAGEKLAGYGMETIAAFAASPPCQFASEQTPMQYRRNHPNLIPETRGLLLEIGKPYAIENVENARRHLQNPVMLCGTMFNLPVLSFLVSAFFFNISYPCLPTMWATTRRARSRLYHRLYQGGRPRGEVVNVLTGRIRRGCDCPDGTGVAGWVNLAVLQCSIPLNTPMKFIVTRVRAVHISGVSFTPPLVTLRVNAFLFDILSIIKIFRLFCEHKNILMGFCRTVSNTFRHGIGLIPNNITPQYPPIRL